MESVALGPKGTDVDILVSSPWNYCKKVRSMLLKQLWNPILVSYLLPSPFFLSILLSLFLFLSLLPSAMS